MTTASCVISRPRTAKATPATRMTWMTIQRPKALSPDSSGGRLAIEHFPQLRGCFGDGFGARREQFVRRVIAPGDADRPRTRAARHLDVVDRSEERRVGKECGARRAAMR